MNAGVPGEKSERKLVVCDADLLDIIPDYLDDKRNECPRLRELAGQGDFEEIRVMAHGMKGSGGCFGFPEISEIARKMETAAKAGNLSDLLNSVDTLEAYLACIEVQYE